MRLRDPRTVPAPLLLALVLTLPACAKSEDPSHQFSSDVERCKRNLREIFVGLRTYAEEHGSLPQARGAALLAELMASGAVPEDEAGARLLTCPGVDPRALAIAELPPTEWYDDPSAVDGDWTAYAARDLVEHPLDAFPTGGREAMVACDNRHGMNHDDVTNVLYADGSITSFELSFEIGEGYLEPTYDRIPIGPGSPYEELRTLSQE